MAEILDSATVERPGVRPWTVRALGLLLLLQAIAYVALSFYLLLRLDWSEEAISRLDYAPTPQQTDALTVSFVLIPSAIVVIVSAVGFFFLHRVGWLLAMTMQGATLLGCLALYFESKPWAIFPAMLFCIIMAFYLNSSDVRITFDQRTTGREY
jgi:hypothetical protein